MRGSQGTRALGSSSQQPSPLQPAHLRLGSQPDSKAQHDASRPRQSNLDCCMSQPASSQHSLKGGDELCTGPQVMLEVAQRGDPADAADAERAVASLDDSRVQGSQHAGHGMAGGRGVMADGVAHGHQTADQGPGEQRDQAQQAAEHRPWEEAVQLLHFLACQISKREGTLVQRSQASQPCDSSQRPQHASQPVSSAQCTQPLSQHPPVLAQSQVSQPEPFRAQPSKATGSCQQDQCGVSAEAGHTGDTRQESLLFERRSGDISLQRFAGVEASQGQHSDSRPGTTSTGMGSSSRSVSCAEGARQQCTRAAACATAHLRVSQPGLTEQPSHGVHSHGLGIQWTPGTEYSLSQHSVGPSQVAQQSADKSDVQTTHGSSTDVGGPDDLPGARLRRPAASKGAPDGPMLDSNAAQTASQDQPGSALRTQTTIHSQPDAEAKAGSVSAKDGGQSSEGTQATQVEGEGPGAGQTELTLCLQLSSEDQDLACGQQPSASLHPTGALEPHHGTPP